MNLNFYRVWLIRFIFINVLFLGAQFTLILMRSSHFIYALTLPVSVYFELVFTLFIHLFLYVLLSFFQTILLWGVNQYQGQTNLLQRLRVGNRWHLVIWCVSICFIVTCNSHFFPLSTFSRRLWVIPHQLLTMGFYISTLTMSLLTLNAGIYIARKLIATPRTKPSIRHTFRHKKSLLFFLGLLTVLLGFYNFMPLATAKKRAAQPNIIMIGIDSLPPNAINATTTPTLARYIRHSVLFKETISPLARTYPAWTSILTGLYPQHHAAHYNLMPPDLVKSTFSIAWDLKKRGYQTLFASDDRRFNNLGTEFGFEKIIGPKVGVNDMLLGTFNDYPLSNLFINLPISRWLFPYNYINRASHFSYYPTSFDHAVKTALMARDKSSPLFFAIHFTLPHWPYAFATSDALQVKDEYSVEQRTQLYTNAVRAADQQVAQLLHLLQRQGYLEQSLVILLSDHGETFYVPGSRQTRYSNYQGHSPSRLADYFKRKTSTTLEKSAGHGSDLLSPAQYHCVLAFKHYENNQSITIPKQISTRVALIDIAPTIYDFLGITQHHKLDGVSLLAAINTQQDVPERAFIMESGMLPNLFLNRQKTLALGQKFFRVDQKTGQLELRKDMFGELDRLKLYGIIKGDWLLALYPDDKGYIPVIQRLSDGQWVDDMQADFAQSTPAASMLKTVEKFYSRPWPLISRATQ